MRLGIECSNIHTLPIQPIIHSLPQTIQLSFLFIQLMNSFSIPYIFSNLLESAFRPSSALENVGQCCWLMLAHAPLWSATVTYSISYDQPCWFFCKGTMCYVIPQLSFSPSDHHCMRSGLSHFLRSRPPWFIPLSFIKL